MKCWQQDTLKYYYEGLRGGTYPSAIMDMLSPLLKNCTSVIDICSGPGAFSLYALIRGWRVTAVDLSATALMALETEAHHYRPTNLTTLCADFLTLCLPAAADVAVAALCFADKMAGKTALAKILDCGRLLAVYVIHDGAKTPEFGIDNLPVDENDKTLVWEENHMEENLAAVAAEQGLPLHCQKLVCDFGCYYHEGDETLISFISRKTGVTDRKLLTRHLTQSARPRGGQLWLANLRPLKVYWIKNNRQGSCL